MIGATLFIHTQYGTPEAVVEAVSKHHYQGASIILAEVFKAAEVLWHRKRKWLAFPWIAMLLVAAALLISYEEPEGAFGPNSSNQRGNAKTSTGTFRFVVQRRWCCNRSGFPSAPASNSVGVNDHAEMVRTTRISSR